MEEICGWLRVLFKITIVLTTVQINTVPNESLKHLREDEEEHSLKVRISHHRNEISENQIRLLESEKETAEVV